MTIYHLIYNNVIVLSLFLYPQEKKGGESTKGGRLRLVSICWFSLLTHISIYLLTPAIFHLKTFMQKNSRNLKPIQKLHVC